MFNNRTRSKICKSYLKDGASYLAFHPTLPLRTKCQYVIDFKNVDHRYNAFANCELRLEKLFDVTKDGEKKLNIRTTIKNNRKIPAYELYFVY